ncbi:MAG: hypothetical protein SGCHY_002769 [Lobulomycetales sp.]
MASDEEDKDKANQYYAGGEKSGQMVQGAPSSDRANQLVKDILQMAAEQGSSEQAGESGAQRIQARPPTFTGRGNRLGGENDPVATSSAVAAEQTQASGEDLPLVERRLTFYRNGFVIDNHPEVLHDYNDPRNQLFLKQLKDGMANLAFLELKQGQEVELKVEHKSEEDFQPPKPKMKAFAGSGNRLGAPVTPASSSSSAAALPVASNTAPSYTVDDSQPTTSIQIRLADGSRQVARFNHSHTVGDVRQFIAMSRPGEASRVFALMTTFPNKELTDNSLSLKDAGLLGTVIVQKYI